MTILSDKQINTCDKNNSAMAVAGTAICRSMDDFMWLVQTLDGGWKNDLRARWIFTVGSLRGEGRNSRIRSE